MSEHFCQEDENCVLQAGHSSPCNHFVTEPAPAEYTCPRCGSNVSTHICMKAEPVAGEAKWSTILQKKDETVVVASATADWKPPAVAGETKRYCGKCGVAELGWRHDRCPNCGEMSITGKTMTFKSDLDRHIKPISERVRFRRTTEEALMEGLREAHCKGLARAYGICRDAGMTLDNPILKQIYHESQAPTTTTLGEYTEEKAKKFWGDKYEAAVAPAVAAPAEGKRIQHAESSLRKKAHERSTQLERDFGMDIVASTPPIAVAAPAEIPCAPLPDCDACHGTGKYEDYRGVHRCWCADRNPATIAAPAEGKKLFTAKCMACGEEIGSAHGCKVKLSTEVADMMVALAMTEGCDHYCCGKTPQVCQADSMVEWFKQNRASTPPTADPAKLSAEGFWYEWIKTPTGDKCYRECTILRIRFVFAEAYARYINGRS